jgi:predicted nuclease of restriction endonuclease-like RecB superfamily
VKSKDQILLENAYARTYGIRNVKDSELEQMIEDLGKINQMHSSQLIQLRDELQKAIGVIDARMSSSKQVKDIADKHGVSIEEIEAQLVKGADKEHTEHKMEPATARMTALQHLAENPKYYDNLEKVEGK